MDIKLQFTNGDTSEFCCSRYFFSPIQSEGFLLLEEDNTKSKAYIQLKKLKMMTAVESENKPTELSQDKGIGIYRKTFFTTNDFMMGDQVAIGHYTATCQRVDEKGALFFMNQYDDEARPMNEGRSNEGGYENSDLRKYLQSEEALADFPGEIRSRLVPFENGDLIRIPTIEELFGETECDMDDGSEWAEHLGGEQLPLMKAIANRIAFRKNNWEWGWLQNRIKTSAAHFASVYSGGFAANVSASLVVGVRRAFLIK